MRAVCKARIVVFVFILVGLQPVIPASAGTFAFTQTLRRGGSGEEIRQLQQTLKTVPEIYPEGLVTGYFGSFTEKAVKKLQAKYGLEPVSIVGPKTRALLNTLMLTRKEHSTGTPVVSAPSPQNSALQPSSTTSAPHLLSLSPSIGSIGTFITITGTGFTQENNDVHFGNGGTRGASSTNNGTTLTFTIPASIGGCYWEFGSSSACTEPITAVASGESYPLVVANANGRSSALVFSIAPKEDQAPNNAPAPQTQTSEPPAQPASNIPPCVPGKNDYFSVSPLASQDIAYINPLGNLNPPGHTFPNSHIGLYTTTTGEENATLYAPGDIWVTNIRQSITAEYTDYALDFSPCVDLSNTFGHVRTLAAKLQDAFQAPFDRYEEYTSGGTASKNYYKKVAIHLSPGETMGTVLRRGALDFTTIDQRIPEHVFANPDRWGNNSLSRMVCPIDYYTSDVKNILRNLFGVGPNTLRTIEPRCGAFAEDIPRTAQGNWFLIGSPTYPEDPHLALVRYDLDPAIPMFSVGNGLSMIGIDHGVYYFTPSHAGEYNREFGEVTPDGKTYCYDTNRGWPAWNPPSSVYQPLLIQLTSPTTLRVAKPGTPSCGSGPWFIGENFVAYER